MLAAMSQQQHVAQSFLTGAQVLVKGYDCKGTVRYYGPHLSKAKRIVYGIELDEPLGSNDGSVYDKKYFSCTALHGVLVRAAHVQKWTKAKAAEQREVKAKNQERKAGKRAASRQGKASEDYGGFGDDGDGGFEGNNDSGFGDELGGFGGFEEVTPAEKVAAAIAEAKEISSSLPTSLPKPNSDEEFELDGFGTDEDDVYDNNDYDGCKSREMTVVAKFDFTGHEEEDLAFKKGDKLTAKDIGDEEWWLAKNGTGQTGMIPLEYVEIKSV